MFKLFSTSTSYPHFIHTKFAHFSSYSQSYTHYPHFQWEKPRLFNRYFPNICFVYFYGFRYFAIFLSKSIDILIVKLCRFRAIIVSHFDHSVRFVYYIFYTYESIIYFLYIRKYSFPGVSLL